MKKTSYDGLAGGNGGDGLEQSDSRNRVNAPTENRPRSNLAALFETNSKQSSSSHVAAAAINLRRQPVVIEAKPIIPSDTSGSLVKSAPAHMIPFNAPRIIPPPNRISSSVYSAGGAPKNYQQSVNVSADETTDGQHQDGKSDRRDSNTTGTSVRRCISSKELGTLAPPTGSPFASMLYQREILQAQHQQRLMESRRADASSNAPSDQSSNLSGIQTAQDISHGSGDSSGNKRRSQLKNESRNQRRAEHTKAVIFDLCEIVADLFIAESKLLNPSSYGVASTFQRDHVLKNVQDFVSALPPRYALGVDTPSEVLLHMRLMAAARSDHSKAVVHVTNLMDSHWGLDNASSLSSRDQNRKLVTISCVDAYGLLEYMTKLLATGGSRVVDADVMLSSDGIALDRFVVQMKGRLRLDRLSQRIETFLSKAKDREGDEFCHSSNHSLADRSSEHLHISGPLSGPLYFHAPIAKEPSPENIQEEIESAVPLSQILAASSSTNALTSLVPRRGAPAIRRELSVPNRLLQPVFANESSTHSQAQPLPISEQQVGEDTDSSSPRDIPIPPTRSRRPLVNREAISFTATPPEVMQPTIDYVTVPNAQSRESENLQEDRIIPLIPFDELMLIETLGNGRVSTIYRAAWRQNNSANDTLTLSNVDMVALKVATVILETEDTAHVDELRREADIAAMLSHKNVCQLVGIAADAECFCLAYDFCEGGSLLDLLSDTRRYYEYLPIALDVANGMAYLHAR